MTADSTVRVFIADDHHLFRAGLAELLAADRSIEIVGQATSGSEVLGLATESRPDVVLLDVSMPGPGMASLVEGLVAGTPPIAVIILSMHDDPQIVTDALQAGARGYLLKSAQRDELLSALHLVARTKDEITIQVSRTTALRLTDGPARTVLSPRESQVLSGLDQANTNRQIGAELHISEATVKRHLTTIYDKLNASSRVDALRKARALGLLP